MTDRAYAVSSYAGGAAAVVSALTLTEIGIIVGIVTALLTFAMNIWYQTRKDRREQQAHDLNMARLLADRRQRNDPVSHERRHHADCPEECPYEQG